MLERMWKKLELLGVVDGNEKNGVAVMEDSIAIPQKLNTGLHGLQQFHLCVYTQNTASRELGIYTPMCIAERLSNWPRVTQSNAYQQRDGSTKRTIIQLSKGILIRGMIWVNLENIMLCEATYYMTDTTHII